MQRLLGLLFRFGRYQPGRTHRPEVLPELDVFKLELGMRLHVVVRVRWDVPGTDRRRVEALKLVRCRSALRVLPAPLLLPARLDS